MEKLLRKFYPSSVLVGQPNFGSYVWVGEELADNADIVEKEHIWLSVEYGEFCPLNCKHCMWKKQVARDQIRIDILLKRLEEMFASRYKPEYLSISGKEPSVTPKETVMISSKAKKYDLKTIMMTNGIGLTPKFAERTSDTIDIVDLSIDGTKVYHEEIRGKGTFEKAVRALESALYYGDYKYVGIISTATHLNYKGIAPLLHELVDKFSIYVQNGKLRFSIGMYYGLPGDELILTIEDIMYLIDHLSSIGTTVRWIIFPNYFHLLGELFDYIGITTDNIKYCTSTGLGVVEFGDIKFILPNHIRGNLFVPRISTDGYLFVACTHLLFDEVVSQYSIGDIVEKPIPDILSDFFLNPPDNFAKLLEEPEECKKCPYYELCGGGDRLLGVYLGDVKARNPFCEKLITVGRV